MVDVALTTLSTDEVCAFLEEDGYNPGTEAFRAERFRRYSMIEGLGRDFCYVERDDWSGDRKRAS